MLPSGARKVSLRWCRVLAQVSFLRYNYRVFNDVRSMPTWVEQDSLLVQEMQALVAMLHASIDATAEGNAHLQPLFDPFL